MNKTKPSLAGPILVAITFLVMITANMLANILPVNGQTTGEVSNKYDNLFAPAALTFTIWGLIYLLLAVYVIAQLIPAKKAGESDQGRLRGRVGFLFIISSLANAVWIFTWHYEVIPASLLLTLIMLISLIFINEELRRATLTPSQRIWLRLPFSIYFGWLTVATIANITTLLVSLGWSGQGLGESTWMIIALVAGLAIGLATMLRNRDISYGLVLLWAYSGILIKRLSTDGFAGESVAVIVTVCICLAGFLLGEIYLLFSRRQPVAAKKAG